jgi:hypothetical protein
MRLAYPGLLKMSRYSPDPQIYPVTGKIAEISQKGNVFGSKLLPKQP